MKTLANKITAVRLFLVPVFLILAYSGYQYLSAAAFIVSSVSDFIDGYIARKYNQVTVLGQFIDPLADKIMVISAMCYFVDMHRFAGWALAIICFREFAISGLRLVATQKGKVIAAAKSGKVKTLVTMICLSAMLVFSVPAIDTVSEILILITTVFSGIAYFIVNKDVYKEFSK